MSSTFVHSAARPPVAPLDPHKHVNYTIGMVLGVDDFNQEFTYLAGRDQWLARELLGYGTVSGLQVSADLEHDSPTVFVEPGVALSPGGQLIRVPLTQCAHLNAWLNGQQSYVQNLSLAPGQSQPLTLYVVLSYRADLTDSVPIAAESSISTQSTSASSRISDDFQLDLRYDAPDQRDDGALQAFVAWLRQVRVGDAQTTPGESYTSLEDFTGAIRAAANLPASLTASPPAAFMSFGSPTGLLIPAGEAGLYWRTACRLWATELRPQWQPASGTGDVPDDDSVLLATLHLQISLSTSDAATQTPQAHQARSARGRRQQGKHAEETSATGQEGDGEEIPAVTISVDSVDDADRPYLLPLRLLQEWMQSGRRETPAADTVADGRQFGQASNAGKAESYSRADHSHGTPALRGDVTANKDGSITVQGLQTRPISGGLPEDGQALIFNAGAKQWQAASLPPISTVPAEDGQVLMYNADEQQWQPADLPDEDEDEEEEEDNSVEHPRGAGSYRIVAAGLVRCDGESQFATYNGLVARAEEAPASGRSTGLVLLHFRGYEEPKRHPYIVKALPKLHGRTKSILVHFERFERHGIMLRITDGTGNPIHHDQLRQLELMIEISHYA